MAVETPNGLNPKCVVMASVVWPDIYMIFHLVKKELTIETLAGLIKTKIYPDQDMYLVAVDMGEPIKPLTTHAYQLQRDDVPEGETKMVSTFTGPDGIHRCRQVTFIF